MGVFNENPGLRTALLIALVTLSLWVPPAIVAKPSPAPHVTLGVTVLLRDSLHLIRGKRVGLITNHTGRDERGQSTAELIRSAPDVRLTTLFAPEHGFRGVVEGGERIASGTDGALGVPVYSLYGSVKAPTPQMLENVDVLIYDIQDVGARVYTYVWTMTLAAEAAKKSGKRFIVLDRPNPVRADIVEGGPIEPRYRSFTGLHNVPLRYGLTAGELARYLVGTKQIDADVLVVPMKDYRLSMWWTATGLAWVNPSPNIRDADAALLYSGTVFFEATNLSEGRGTDAPLKQVGAPWLTDADDIAKTLNRRGLGGVRLASIRRKVAGGEKFGGQTIPMIRLIITDRDALRPVEIGAHMLREIYTRHPREFRWKGQGIEELSGSRALRNAVEHGGVDALLTQWRGDAEQFSARSAPFRLYRP
jgi:uncharacterized protein YbbC (DUF1343 family)